MIQFFDGALGTYYLTKTNDYSPCEEANLTHPDVVRSIHKEYIRAGVDAIKTNTFRANRFAYPDETQLEAIIESGFSLAVQAAENTGVCMFADIGYIPEEHSTDEYIYLSDLFLRLGANHFLFETLNDFDSIFPVAEHIKSKNKSAVIAVSFAILEDGYSKSGLYYQNLLQKVDINQYIDIIGLNCVCGPMHLLRLTKKLTNLTKPLCIMPNAGYPSSVNGRMVFEDNAEYFAEKLSEIKKAGADIVGGCCGTTPKHLELAIQRINGISTTPAKQRTVSEKRPIHTSNKKHPLKPIAVELDPPLNSNFSFISKSVDILKQCGVSEITLSDSPLAKARADSFLSAVKIKNEASISVLPHLTCRDKNLIAIKGTLIGAHFNGIHQLLVITGDPVPADTIYKKPGVFHLNSMELISYISNLNREIFTENPFIIGGALNVNAKNFNAELARAEKKIANGASFILSQPIFSKEAIDCFKKAKQTLDCKLYAGIWPIASYKNAVFLNNEVSGIDIPLEIVETLKDKSPREVYEISTEYSKSIIDEVIDYADGFYIMTPLRKVSLVKNLIERCFDV